MKSTKLWRELELVGVTFDCPYCFYETELSTADAEQVFTNLWYPHETNIKCRECGNEFLVDGGEDNI